MYEDVTQDELASEFYDEPQKMVSSFMDDFVDREGDALPIDQQIRRIIMYKVWRNSKGN